MDKLTGRGTMVGLVAGLLLLALAYQIWLAVIQPPWAYLAALESRHQYLLRTSSNYAASDFANRELPPEAKMLLLWEARSYYLRRVHITDSTHVLFGYLIGGSPSEEEMLRRLEAMGVTHVMVSPWVQERAARLHDPQGMVARDGTAFALLQAKYLRLIFQAKGTHIYALPAAAPEGRPLRGVENRAAVD